MAPLCRSRLQSRGQVPAFALWVIPSQVGTPLPSPNTHMLLHPLHLTLCCNHTQSLIQCFDLMLDCALTEVMMREAPTRTCFLLGGHNSVCSSPIATSACKATAEKPTCVPPCGSPAEGLWRRVEQCLAAVAESELSALHILPGSGRHRAKLWLKECPQTAPRLGRLPQC